MKNLPKEVPMLFSTAMVQAILAGRKTQTRRIVTPTPDERHGLHDHTRFPMALDINLEGWWGTVDETGESRRFRPRAEPGDIICVRENCLWVQLDHAHDLLEGARSRSQWAYQASMHEDWMEYAKEKYGYKWNPSIHMPKDAARIWLRCTDVRAERAQDISEADAIAEGIETLAVDSGADDYATYYRDYGQPFPNGNDGWPWFNETDAVQSFRSLWQSIHSEPPKPGKPDGRWDANPWVWVYEFEVLSTTGKPANI